MRTRRRRLWPDPLRLITDDSLQCSFKHCWKLLGGASHEGRASCEGGASREGGAQDAESSGLPHGESNVMIVLSGITPRPQVVCRPSSVLATPLTESSHGILRVLQLREASTA